MGACLYYKRKFKNIVFDTALTTSLNTRGVGIFYTKMDASSGKLTQNMYILQVPKNQH